MQKLWRQYEEPVVVKFIKKKFSAVQYTAGRLEHY